MTNAVFGKLRFAQLEPTLRTGDVILFSDPDATMATRRSARLLDRAVSLVRLLSYLPCTVHHQWAFDDDRAVNFEADFVEKRQAAFIIEMQDDTHTNPRNDSDKLLAYIFVPSECLIVPLREFVALMQDKEPRFTYRRLSVSEEYDTTNAQNAMQARVRLAERLYTHCA